MTAGAAVLETGGEFAGTATTLPLRPYQQEAFDAVHAAWEKGVNRVAVVIPTGGGKTVAFAHLAAAEPGRTLILAHRRELVDQAAGTLRAVAPGMPVGIDMADRVAGPGHRAVVASVQTLASERRIRRWARDAFTRVIVDECHHSLADTYIKILDYFGCMDGGGTRTLGVTATLARGDGIGLGSVWPEVAYTVSILDLIAGGYLVNPKGISVPIGIDLGRAEVSHGDYTAGSLGDLLTESGFADAVAEVWAEHAAGRPGLVFTPTVATARDAADALRAAGFKAEAVWGAMDDDIRAKAVDGLRNGSLDVLCNCAVLTEGTDIPRAEVALMGRPTRSRVLFAQMAGRVLRPYPGKHGALIIDIAGVTADNKLCTLVDLADGELPERREKEPPEDGETLTEAVERVTKVKLGAARNVDLFAQSEQVWLQTRGGFWFVPAGGGHVALYTNPVAPGRYAVALFPPGPGRPVYATGPIDDLALAMAIGAEHARRADRAADRRFGTANRGAAWRSRPPSGKQVAAAARMRIEIPPGARAGEISDLMEAKIASRRIDRHLGRPAGAA